jgi:DNA-binding transcriptional LysR family regulator
MKLQFLRYFCVLAEELHFRRAADRLAISQPPLSTAIRLLEEELGVQLLLRNSKMVQLTPAGAAFLVEAREILERVSRVGSVVRAIDGGAHGRLDIGFAGSMLYRETPAILARFKRDVPAVDVVLYELYTTEQIEKLMRRQLHAAFIQASVLPAPLTSIPLRDDVFVACLPEHHRLAGNARVDLREMADEPFVMFSRESAPASHDHVIGIFSQAGIHPRTVHQARIWMTVVAMVANGCGIALVPQSLSRTNIGGVRFIPLAGTPANAPALLAWNPSMMPLALEKFLASATATIRQQAKSPARKGHRQH